MSEPFPSIRQAALLLLANFLLNYVVALALHDFQHGLGLNQFQQDALGSLLGNGILLACVMHYCKMGYGDLIHPSPSSIWVTTILLVPAVLLLVPMLFLASTGLMTLLEKLWPLSGWEQRAFELMSDDNFAALLSTCILAPVLEEMLFRGVLLRAFLRRYPRGFAIAASALFFGVAHLNIYQFALAFLMGLLLGWLYERSHSLIPGIALHAGFNSTSIWFDHDAPSGTEFDLGDISVWTWSLSAVAAVLAALLLMRLLGMRRRPQDMASN